MLDVSSSRIHPENATAALLVCLKVSPVELTPRDAGVDDQGRELWRGERLDLLTAPLLNDAEVLAHVMARHRCGKPFTAGGPSALLAVHSGR